MHPGTSNDDDDDSSDDEGQPDSDQVGVPESAQNQVDQDGNPEDLAGETERNQQVTADPPSAINQQPGESTSNSSQANINSASTNPSTAQPTRRSIREWKPFDKYGFDKTQGHMAWKTDMEADLYRNGRKQVFKPPKYSNLALTKKPLNALIGANGW